MVGDIYFALNSHFAPLPSTARIGPGTTCSLYIYKKKLITEQLKKATDMSRESLLAKKNVTQSKGVPFVMDYSPSIRRVSGILYELFPLLHLEEESKRVFTHRPFVSFRNPRNLASYLVRAKVSPEQPRVVGSKKCGKPRCLTCNNIKETDFFVCNNTEKTFKINHKLDCNDKCLVYLLSCKVCGLQYVGQTSDRFRFRWNNYKSCQRKIANGEECTFQTSLHKHFLSDGHHGLLNDVEITLIDKTDASAPTEREFFWITTLKTLKPNGLNEEERY